MTLNDAIERMQYKLNDVDPEGRVDLCEVAEWMGAAKAAQAELTELHAIVDRLREPVRTSTRAAVPDGHVLVAIERGEGYEDAHPDLVAEDCMSSAVERGWRYRVLSAAPSESDAS